MIMSDRENPSLQGWDDNERQTREGFNSLANQTGFCIHQVNWLVFRLDSFDPDTSHFRYKEQFTPV